MNANKYASVTKWQAFCKTLSAYWCSATKKKVLVLLVARQEYVALLLVARQEYVLHHVTSLDRWTCSLLLLHSKCRSSGRCINGI